MIFDIYFQYRKILNIKDEDNGLSGTIVFELMNFDSVQPICCELE